MKFKKDSAEQFDIAKIIANKVNNEIFPKGMESILEKKPPPESEPHILYIFSCPKRFFSEYSSQYTSLSSKSNIKDAIKITNEIDDDIIDNMKDDCDLKKNLTLINEEESQELLKKYTSYLVKNTNFYVKMIIKSFENLNEFNRKILGNLIDLRAGVISEKLQREDSASYNMLNTNENQEILNKSFYYEFHFVN